MDNYIKYLSSPIGALLAFFAPIWVYLFIAALIIIADCYTSFQLSRRVRKRHDKSAGKFRSDKASKVFVTFIKVAVCIILAYFIDHHIIKSPEDWAQRCVIGIFIFIEIWSILENESSCSDKKWAIIMQRIMIDKTERHFDIKLDELKK